MLSLVQRVCASHKQDFTSSHHLCHQQHLVWGLYQIHVHILIKTLDILMIKWFNSQGGDLYIKKLIQGYASVRWEGEDQRNGVSGWCSGKNTRLLPMQPGFDSWPGKYVSWVCGPSPMLEVFSGYSGFLIHHTYIIFRCSPRGFSATCLQQMQGSVVEGLSQTATSGSQWFFVWDIRLCPQLTVHNTGISLLLCQHLSSFWD